MRCVLKVAAFVAVVSSLCLISAQSTLAHSGSGGNCAGCHGPEADKGTVTSPTSITATPGVGVVEFTINVLNGITASRVALTGKGETVGSGLGTGTESITAVTGSADAAHTLSVPVSSGWTLRTVGGVTYYTAASDPAVTYSKTYSFTVPAGTPADTYNMVLLVAGSDRTDPAAPVKWVQSTGVSVIVGEVPEPATLAMLLGGALVGLVCWRGRKHLAAK
jgi:hypothetical protein